MLADLLAQSIVLATFVVAIANRHLLDDLTDGNVERLEREERAWEARLMLALIDPQRRQK